MIKSIRIFVRLQWFVLLVSESNNTIEVLYWNYMMLRVSVINSFFFLCLHK